ncbi:MAG: TonB family protein [Opitutaceae bacterium]|jgi:TonB family protein|nr:TonB family protein [Opitutaceae bacterium]
MRPNSSSAFLTSLILHGFVAALLFVTTIYVARSDKLPPVIFELVAGPGEDMNAREAPAEGNTAMKVNVPKVELPQDKPEPPQVQESVSVPETAPPKPPPVKAKSDTSIAKQMNKSAKVSYQEYLKKHPTPKQSAASTVRRNAKVPKIDTQGVLGGVKGGSTASTRGSGGKALTREEQDQLSTYISFLIQELKRAHEPPSGVSDQLEAKVTFDITASGAILNPRISKSSGNREFDESVLDAFRRMRSIGPTPNRRPDTWTVTFRMRDEA